MVIQTEKPIFVRADPKLRAAVELIRQNLEPTPTIADAVRMAVFQMAKQYQKKANGHRGRGK